jgi:hypothetical protein
MDQIGQPGAAGTGMFLYSDNRPTDSGQSMQGANLSVRSGAITLGNQLNAPDKHKN